MNGMKVRTFQPTRLKYRFYQCFGDTIVRIPYQTSRVRNLIFKQQSSHSLTCTILDTMSGIDRKAILFFFQLLQLPHRSLTTHHGKYILLVFQRISQEFLFRIHIHLMTIFFQILGNSRKDGGIIADMIG